MSSIKQVFRKGLIFLAKASTHVLLLSLLRLGPEFGPRGGFSLVRNSAVADRTDRGLSVEDGRYHRLLIENVYNVEFAIVLVSELQTNIFAHPSSNRKYCWEGIKNATFITYQQGRIKIRKCHTKTSTAKLCELLRQIVRKAINCMHSLQAYGTATGLAWCIG